MTGELRRRFSRGGQGVASWVNVEVDSCRKLETRGGSLGRMTLGSTTQPLSATYDLAMLDLDGVVYRGPDADRAGGR